MEIENRGGGGESAGAAHLGVHQAEGQADRDAQDPDEGDLQRDPLLRLIAPEFHRVAQAQVTIYAYGTQVHYAGGAEQDVEADPGEAINRRQREVSCETKRANESPSRARALPRARGTRLIKSWLN